MRKHIETIIDENEVDLVARFYPFTKAIETNVAAFGRFFVDLLSIAQGAGDDGIGWKLLGKVKIACDDDRYALFARKINQQTGTFSACTVPIWSK